MGSEMCIRDRHDVEILRFAPLLSRVGTSTVGRQIVEELKEPKIGKRANMDDEETRILRVRT